MPKCEVKINTKINHKFDEHVMSERGGALNGIHGWGCNAIMLLLLLHLGPFSSETGGVASEGHEKRNIQC